MSKIKLSRFHAIKIAFGLVLLTALAGLISPAPCYACGEPGKDGIGSLSGVINTYYPGVSSVSTGATDITLGTAIGNTQTIAAGDLILIIQMQDAEINSANTDAYGNGIGGDVTPPTNPNPQAASGAIAINSAGLYEFNIATTPVGAGGGLLTLVAPLLNAYTDAGKTATFGQRRFQVVRVPQYASATLVGTVTATPWNGAVGGVVAFDVAGRLDFNGAGVDVSGQGFRGGRAIGSAYENIPSFMYVSDINKNSGYKGEGIAGTPTEMWNGTAIVTGSGYPGGNRAMGAPGNAGGGGTADSAGGGGANVGAGGRGGDEYCGLCGYTPDKSSPDHTPGALGGMGGLVPSGSLNATRMIMGGGGGGGADHNSVDPNRGHGGVGGGIVLIRTGISMGNGLINANGGIAPNPSGKNDGNAGGGGAGGSVFITSSSPLTGLTITAKGGNGGNVTNHAPGGGGGGGTVYHSNGASVDVVGGANGTRSKNIPLGAINATSGGSGTSGPATPTDSPGSGGGATCLPILTTIKTTPTPAPTGPTANYNITVSNAVGRGTATGMSILDNLPPPFTYMNTPVTVTYAGKAIGPASPIIGIGPDPATFGIAGGDITNSFILPGGGNVTLSFSVNTNNGTGLFQNPADALFLDPTRTLPGQTVTPGGVYNSGPVVAGANYDPLLSPGEDIHIGVLGPAVITFLRHLPEAATILPADGGSYQNNANAFTPLPSPTDLFGEAIDTTSVPVHDADLYHVREAIVVRLDDLSRNADPLIREFIEVTITTSTGDTEVVILQETGVNTGSFATVIQGVEMKGSPVLFDGQLSLTVSSRLSVSYVYQGSLTITDSALVDPFGIVFDSTSGQPVDGATIALIDINTDQAATVRGDDGISIYPNILQSGSGRPGVTKPNLSMETARSKAFMEPDAKPVVDSSGRVYTFPPGGFRFPFIPPGDYILKVTPPMGYTAPSVVPLSNLQTVKAPQGNPYVVDEEGSRGRLFKVNLGSPINIDIPIDPIRSNLLLTKNASRTFASAGDFVQYRLTLQNLHGTSTATSVTVTDRLPSGIRYEKGSLHRDGKLLADPVLTRDGRTLTFTIGHIAPGQKAEITYVVSVGAVARPGPAVNSAIAVAQGDLPSNKGEATLHIQEPLHQGHFTIIGRVLEGDCKTASGEIKGIPNIRILMEDGTSILTDPDGQYHFRGVRPGTHVVQLDVNSLPPHLTVMPCIDNSRFAGRAFSQFVEAQGGSLWRADFYVGPKAPMQAPVQKPPEERSVGIRMEGAMTMPQTAPSSQKLTFRFSTLYNNLSAQLTPEAMKSLQNMVSEISQMSIERIEVIGHTDSNDIHPIRRRLFANNYALSTARAQSVVNYLYPALKLLPSQVTAIGRGPDQPITSNVTHEGRAKNRRVEIIVYEKKEGQESPTINGRMNYRLEVDGGAIPILNLKVIATLPKNVVYIPDTTRMDGDRADDPEVVGDRLLYDLGPMGSHFGHEIIFSGEIAAPSDAAFSSSCIEEGLTAEAFALIETASGEQAKTPTATIKIQCPASEPDKTTALRLVALSAKSERLATLLSPDNADRKDLSNMETKKAPTDQDIRSTRPSSRVILAPEASVLVADGVTHPMIAVRLLDRKNYPMPAGLTGTYQVNAPYLPEVTLTATGQRQLAGLDRFDPTFTVHGEDGMAYITLAPTTETGRVALTLTWQEGGTDHHETLHVWLEPVLRDWVVVGFAEGEVGYNQLKGNMESLAEQGEKKGMDTHGKASLYAKGRVRGKWLLTLAYNSDKGNENRAGLFSGIDPDQYYTIYGDATHEQYDATSRENLYLKLSRDQFYVMFGDYDTGLTETQLGRYNRSMTGIKTEYHGEVADLTVYGAETDLHYLKQEIQGNGTSGLYSLLNGQIVVNSEKIRIETRDRLKSEQIIKSRPLVRHLDYDIDYIAGTLFFREPIHSRDTGFNPIFIVVEYETTGAAKQAQNAGGRIGGHLLDNRLTLGVSHIRDESDSGKRDLSGLDIQLKLAKDSWLRVEGATSEGQAGTLIQEGDAFLVELEHHDLRWDALAYVRRQEPGFGVGQQNGSESGTAKRGAEGRLRLTEQVGLQAELYQQENLLSEARRDVARLQLERETDLGTVYAGGQFASDRFKVMSGDRVFQSEQAVIGGSRYLLDKTLTLQVGAEFPLGNDKGEESIDFPMRVLLGADYAITKSVRLILSQEFTDGTAFDTSTTRAGFQAVPWQGARLTSTINQSQISEYGPRTFGQLGLSQAFLVGERWGVDLAVDSSRTFNEKRPFSPSVNLNHPITTGGMMGEPQDYLAISSGVTYRAEQWSGNARAENRNSSSANRYGLTTHFLRQARAGVAFSLAAQAFQTEQTGTDGRLGNLSLSWAYRPLGYHWSLLDRLEFHDDQIRRKTGSGTIPDFGVPRLPLTGNARSRRLINNFTLNRVSHAWTAKDRQGNLFNLHQRNQWSFYYGAKYALDRIDQKDYRGYTDLTGLEWRYDITRRIDIGMRGSILHGWSAKDYAYGWGPMVGLSPFENGWITLGYNAIGFYDRDFADAGYTRQGPYLRLRIKFDQDTKAHPQKKSP
jgi:uncharacterized repeat protein (TIGR01451 family)